MTKNIVSAAAALIGASTLLVGCFDQPEAGCITQDSGSWQARYILKEGQNIPTECQSKLLAAGETLGVYKFTNPEVAGQTKLTLRPAGLASRGSRDEGEPSVQTAVGSLAEEPDADDFCSATNFSAASVNAAATSSSAATTVQYQYESIRVYSAPDAPGTQLTGELTYTRDECTAQYVVHAIWPAVDCDLQSDKPRDRCGEGSGINPDFAVECLPGIGSRVEDDEGNTRVLGRCVAAKPIPSFKDDRK